MTGPDTQGRLSVVGRQRRGRQQLQSGRYGWHRRLAAAASLMLGLASGAWAAPPLPNADFSAGNLGGWEADGRHGGFAMTARQGSCFSYNDTTGLTLSGGHAALIRSGGEGRLRSVGMLRSPVLEAGTGVVFDALSEVSDGRRTHNPVHFTVAVLDPGGGVLAEHRLHTARVRLSRGCPSYPRNAPFGRHFVDTSAWLGRPIRIEFRQHTNVRGAGYFTLIDNIRFFAAGETPLLEGLPVAVAGSSFRWGSTLHLDGRLSRHPDHHPDVAPLEYTWYIDGEVEPRTGRRVAIDDLPDGNHLVTLFVSDGAHVVADQIIVAAGFGGDDRFELEPPDEPDAGTEDGFDDAPAPGFDNGEWDDDPAFDGD